MEIWSANEPNVVQLPSGKRVRVRSWRDQATSSADVTAILTTVSGKDFSNTPHRSADGSETITIDWPDFRVPRRASQAIEQLTTLWERSASERVEITSATGIGRAGTALAIFLILDGLSPAEAVDWVHAHYSEDAISSHAQRGFLMEFQQENDPSYN